MTRRLAMGQQSLGRVPCVFSTQFSFVRCVGARQSAVLRKGLRPMI